MLDIPPTSVVESFQMIKAEIIPPSATIPAIKVPRPLVSLEVPNPGGTPVLLPQPRVEGFRANLGNSGTSPEAAATPAASCSVASSASRNETNAPCTPFPSLEGEAAPPAPSPCSFNECLSGHIWPAILALSRCPGCTGGVVAVQKTNCPFCNEPITRTVLRSDFVPRGGGVTARCQGTPGIGESLDVEMIRTQWQEIEGTTRSFLEQEAHEITAAAAKESK